MKTFQNHISMVLCGPAGTGIQTVEILLTRLLIRAGYFVYSNKEYMSRVRGGENSTLIRVSDHPVRAWVNRIDLLVPFSAGAIDHLRDRLSPETLVVADRAALGQDCPIDDFESVDVPLNSVAAQIGNPLVSNLVAVGFLAALFGLEISAVEVIGGALTKKSTEVVHQNLLAAKRGHALGIESVSSGRIRIDMPRSSERAERMFLSGGDAIGLGALAGGCNFVSSYPMSPSTPVLTFLAQQAAEMGLIVEQAEDEIAALNMILGAWYAGARGLATTSGGGFSLMAEALSLAGMIETPAVIHLGQRPGPATGLPTRTEQGDLELAVYSGHGEFPRIVLAPGTLEQAYELTRTAFELADRFQSPAIVLSDQYLVDLYYSVSPFVLPSEPIRQHIVETVEDYRRYRISPDGISPRGIPGFGRGLVGVDSDEHDEEAHITEDRAVRIAMHEKRLRKLDLIRAASLRPQAWPREGCEVVVVCWGSTYWIVREALEQMGRDDVGMMHFSQVYPLHPDTAESFGGIRRAILLEGNAMGQFGKLLRLHAGIEFQDRIFKYDGLPFSVEEVVSKLNSLLE